MGGGRILATDGETCDNVLLLPDDGNPVRDAYATAMSQGEKNGRHSWDQTAVLAAVLPVERHFGIERGHVTVGDDGANSWRADPSGPHARLLAKLPREQLANVIEELMMRRPNRP